MAMDSGLEFLYADLSKRLAADPELARLNLRAMARPSVRLAAHRVPSALVAIGESRIGGNPDVPASFEWPRWMPSKPRDDVYATPWRPDGPAPLGFIAQIDLSVIPQVEDMLPNSGWLYFFYDRHCEPWVLTQRTAVLAESSTWMAIDPSFLGRSRHRMRMLNTLRSCAGLKLGPS